MNARPCRGSSQAPAASLRGGRSPRLFFLVALVSVALPVACSDSEPSTGTTFSPVCTRAPALIGDGRACLLDEDCPCGTFCGLGTCSFDCEDASDCNSGQVCDDFGRCSVPELANLPPDVGNTDRGLLLVDRTLVELLDADAVQQARVQARFEPLPEVRVSADGVEIACGTTTAFGSECRIDDVVPGQPPLPIQIRRIQAGEAPTEDVRGEVVVHAAGQRHVIGVRIPGTPASPAVTRVGVFEGVARLVGAGLTARTVADALPEQLQRFNLPIRIEVYPEVSGTFAVRMFETRGAVFPPGTVGTLSVDNARRWTLQTVSNPLIRGEADDPRAVQINVAGRMDDATFRDGLLDGDFFAVLEGLAPAGREPFLRWRISVSRTGDLPAAAVAPVIPADPDRIDVEARARALFPEEIAVANMPGFGSAGGGAAAAVRALCAPSADRLSTAVDINGDLVCADAGGTSMRAFGVERGRLADRATFLLNCLSSLEPLAAPVLGDATEAGECFDRTRAVYALAAATGVDRNRAFGQGAPDDQSSRLALRLVQQWVNLQAFVGVEPSRVHRVAVIAPQGPTLDALSAFASNDSLFDGLLASIAGWDLVVHPRISAALVAMSPEVLAEPDYRASFGGREQGGTQALGLPVSMLYALTAQIDGLNEIVEDLRFERTSQSGAQRLEETLARFLPRSAVVFALAQGLYDAARSIAVPDDWDDQWQTVRQQYGVSLNRMLRNLELLEAGVNPMGIDELDLPLYRLGDQQGTIDRFSAVSDALLGREDRLEPAIAPTLVTQAQDAVLLARESITALIARDLTQTIQTSETDRRLEAINRHYGEQIASLCGDPSFNALTLLSMADQIDPNTCWLAPGCGFDEQDVRERINLADLGYQVCVAAKLREAYGDAVSTGQATLDRQVDSVSGGFSADTPFFSIDGIMSVISGFASAFGGVSQPRVNLPDGIDADVARRAESLCESGRQATLAARPTEVPTSCMTTDDCPVDYLCGQSTSTCEPDTAVADPSCFYGSLGELAVAQQAAGTDITIARSELQEFSERYDNAMRGCILLAQGNDAIERAIQSHNATMDELGSARLAADIAANTAAAAKDAFSLSKPSSAIGSVLFGAAESAAKSASDTISFRMEQAERAHSLTMAAVENAAEERICYNEAEAELVGARTAALRIRRQAQELARYIVEFQNLKITLGALLSEGVAALENERARRVSPAQIDYWLDDNLALFDLRMRRARRAMYLAVLTVEYEYQFSSLERSAVLAATVPDELEGVLARLRDEVRRGAPSGGGNPTELLTVVSLRRNLLQLADRKDDGRRHELSQSERFRRIVSSPKFAVYDDDGRYVGQEIPFTIQPFGALRLGDAGAIPLLSGLNCAERLWSVNASVLGSDLMNRTDTTIVSLQIRKRNTFSSQWCDGRESSEAQVATTRPSRNLFVDPFSANSWGADRELSQLTDTREVTGFSRATVQARINVTQEELERESFSDGDSTALAGRGVFGDYTLFIPATAQSIEGSAGLRLENVEDVLIRLDYVAAEAR